MNKNINVGIAVPCSEEYIRASDMFSMDQNTTPPI